MWYIEAKNSVLETGHLERWMCVLLIFLHNRDQFVGSNIRWFHLGSGHVRIYHEDYPSTHLHYSICSYCVYREHAFFTLLHLCILLSRNHPEIPFESASSRRFFLVLSQGRLTIFAPGLFITHSLNRHPELYAAALWWYHTSQVLYKYKWIDLNHLGCLTMQTAYVQTTYDSVWL